MELPRMVPAFLQPHDPLLPFLTGLDGMDSLMNESDLKDFMESLEPKVPPPNPQPIIGGFTQDPLQIGLANNGPPSAGQLSMAADPFTMKQEQDMAAPAAEGRTGRGNSTRSSHSGNSSGGKPGGSDAVQRRAATQKRYREKQASLLRTLEQEASAKAAQAAALAEENAALRSREGALEKLLACRDEQMVLLQRVRGLCSAPGADGQPAPGCFGPNCIAPVAGDVERLMRFKSMSVEELRQQWRRFIGRASEMVATLQVQSGAAAVAGAGGQQAALDAITSLVSEMGITMKAAVQLNCPVLYSLQQVDLESGMLAQPDPSHWQRILRVIELTEAQTRDALVIFSLYCDLMVKVHEERRLLKESLAEAALSRTHSLSLGPCSPTPTPATSEGAAAAAAAGCRGRNSNAGSSAGTGGLAHVSLDGGASSGVGAGGCVAPAAPHLLPPTRSCMEEMELTEKLYLNLHKERSTRCLLCCFFFGKMLTPLQLAKLSVASYPFFPDPLGLCRELAAANNHSTACSRKS